jgi:hypothetical protein
MLRIVRPLEIQFIWIALSLFITGMLVWVNVRRAERGVGRRMPLIVGAAWTAVCTAEYWTLGGLSAAGRPDEYNAVIPWLRFISRVHDGGPYAHGWGGGVDSVVGAAVGTQFVSVERLLFAMLPVGAAIVIMKAGAIAIGYAGGYTLARRAVGLTREKAVVVGLLASVAHLYTFAWAVGGVGWAIGLFPWGLYILSRGAGWRWYYGAVAAFALLYSASASLILTFPFFVVGLVLSAILLPPVRAARFAAGIALFIVIVVLNWADVVYASMQLSSELARTGTRPPIPSPFTVLRLNSDAIAVPVVPIALATLAFARHPFVLKATAVFALALYAAPLLAVLARFVPMEMARAYRWELIVDGYVLPAVVIVARALGAARWGAPRAGVIRLPEPLGLTFAAVAVFIAADQKAINILQLQLYGGQALFETALGTGGCDWRPPAGYRVASMPSLFAPSLVNTYGVDTFDGMANGFSRRRRLFFAFAVAKPANPAMHTHVHWLPVRGADTALGDSVNVDALRIGNVRYVLSDRPLPDVALSQVAGPCAGYPRRRAAFEQWVTTWAPRAIPPDYYVYELPGPWPRVFVPASVHVSHHAMTDESFYRELLENASMPAALIAADDAPALPIGAEFSPDYRLVSHRLVPAGFDLHVAGAAAGTRGLVVINVPYSALWRARSGDRNLRVVPVNGIHLGVIVDDNGAVTVRYERQTIGGRVSRAFTGRTAYAFRGNRAGE